MSSLRSFIKSVRSSKTLADERSIIQRESAAIRTSFKDVSITHTQRRILISKLIYLYILGEKTHFGQIECINLLSSPKFADKRLGYLATMLLIDENQEVLTLLTNSIQLDLHHPNNFIQGLALSTLGNVMSIELANDLYHDVEIILKGNNNYLIKKALIVIAKILEKNQDLYEIFLKYIDSLLSNSNHSVLLGILKLIRVIYFIESDILIKYIPKIIDILKNLIANSNNPEYDTMGINDPFLQISTIKTLSLFFTDNSLKINQHYKDLMNDVLTTIISYTSYTKPVGASILYETVKFIFNIPDLDQSLKILGINTLGQLLSVKDNNNNRYIALNLLLKVVELEPLAVQRHQQLIISCLNDLDISIKRRALELSFAILDNSNIRILIREILTFLQNSNEKDLKSYIIENITNILNKSELIPNESWKFETLIKLNKLGGDSINNPTKILSLILNNKDLEMKKFILLKFFQIGQDDFNKIGLNLINVYLIGEYGELLLNQKLQDNTQITEDLILIYLNNLLSLQDDYLNSYIITSILKLSIKFSTAKSQNKIVEIVNYLKNSIDLNIQINSSIYLNLINESNDIKLKILSKIPPPIIKIPTESLALIRSNTISSSSSSSHHQKKLIKTEDLLDLINDNDTVKNNGTSSTLGINNNNQDILQDLFEDSTSSNLKLIQAFINSDLNISFEIKSQNKSTGEILIKTFIKNLSNLNEIFKFQLLIAVPKTQKLTINSNNANNIPINQLIQQDLKIIGNPGSNIKLRVKINYSIDGIDKSETFDYKFANLTL
ncbi:hypothetical protein WICMUC_003309 [Wickerhamomyces mucosus]|uniref:AP-1 complex subunit gamma n=1 Tax=Wickerhamomyces mucosus TaxID=1378264 RepID=A0A9P8PLY1_9ASCO|nr:hypothetical protein WICMUC_003309 [Wickerhamomyces mucosus]